VAAAVAAAVAVAAVAATATSVDAFTQLREARPVSPGRASRLLWPNEERSARAVASLRVVHNTSGMQVGALFSWSVVALAACTDAPSEAVEGYPHAQVSPSGGEERGSVEPAGETAEARAKQAHREPGTTEDVEVDWSDAASHPRADVSGLSDEARASVEASTVPVLLPRDRALLQGAVITHGPTWYAASLHPTGHHIRIDGRRRVVHQPGLEASVPEERRRPPGATSLTRTHGIVSVAFDAFGAAYVLDVECEAPTTDVRCTEDDYARSLVRGLGVAGGAR
jgi:hypothetical protein